MKAASLILASMITVIAFVIKFNNYEAKITSFVKPYQGNSMYNSTIISMYTIHGLYFIS